MSRPPCHVRSGAARSRRRRGYGLVGILVTLVLVLILFVIGMSAMNNAITGGGSTKSGTVRSAQDEMNLYAMFQSLVADSMNRQGRFITPSGLAETDRAADTTANLFSAMVMNHFASVEQVVSANERSSFVWVDDDYDFTAYRPAEGVYWDPSFQADLDRASNTSFAHLPLAGARFDRHWRNGFTAGFVILGNRGPKDGVDDPRSWTYGQDGTWGGHVVWGDGHITFVDSFTPQGAYYDGPGGQRVDDNIFKMEDGPRGADSVLSFTKSMTTNGPELQYD